MASRSWRTFRSPPSQSSVHGCRHPAFTRRGREIFRLPHESPAGAASQAILGTIFSIITPIPFHRRFGASVITNGFLYGVPPGLVFGLPLCTDDGVSWSIIAGVCLSGHAQERLAVNAAELEHEAKVASEILGGHL